MRPIAEVLKDKEYKDDIIFKNTWGDGLFIVLENAVAAAKLAVKMQSALADADRFGLPDDLGLRIGAHFGPTFKFRDPILKKDNYYGSHITLAARLEPIARPGETFTSEAFAVAIALEPNDDLRCEYIGKLPAAKGYGDFPIYVVRD
jgi:class 3 adenylate cyclase